MFVGSQRLEPDLELMIALRQARDNMRSQLMADVSAWTWGQADGQGNDERTRNTRAVENFRLMLEMQPDAVVLLSELFYAIRAMGISCFQAFESFITHHNQHIRRRWETEFCNKSGGLADRIKMGAFSDESIGMLSLIWERNRRLEFSAPDLARLLCELVSDEYVRKILQTLYSVGLLERRKERADNSWRYWSDGILENTFHRYLNDIRRVVSD